MSLLTLTEARDHLETDIPDAALQQLVDDAEDEINTTIGLVDEHSDEFENSAPYPWKLWLSRPADTIDEVTEENGGTVTTLDEDDYRLRHKGRAVERLNTGPNPATRWGQIVNIGYTPVDDTPRRVRVIVDLVKLAAAYSGTKSHSVGGDYSETQKDYEEERSRLISRLITENFA